MTAKERWKRGWSQYRLLSRVLHKHSWDYRHLTRYKDIAPANYGWDVSSTGAFWVRCDPKDYPKTASELFKWLKSKYTGDFPKDTMKTIITRRLKSNYIALSPHKPEED